MPKPVTQQRLSQDLRHVNEHYAATLGSQYDEAVVDCYAPAQPVILGSIESVIPRHPADTLQRAARRRRFPEPLVMQEDCWGK